MGIASAMALYSAGDGLPLHAAMLRFSRTLPAFLYLRNPKTGSRYAYTSEMRIFLNGTDVVHLQDEIVLIPESKYDPCQTPIRRQISLTWSIANRGKEDSLQEMRKGIRDRRQPEQRKRNTDHCRFMPL